MNWTSSFLFQSDKLAIVLHLLLAPASTVTRPAEHEFAHRPSPSPRRCHDALSRIVGRRFARLVEEQGFDT